MSIDIALKASDFAIIIYLVDITNHDARRSFLRPPTSFSPFGVKYSPQNFSQTPSICPLPSEWEVTKLNVTMLKL